MLKKILSFVLFILFLSFPQAGYLEKLEVTVNPDVVNVGQPTSLTVKAWDDEGHILKDYKGTITIIVEDENGKEVEDDIILPGDGSYDFSYNDNGVKVFKNGLQINKGGNYKIIVEDFETEIAGTTKLKVVTVDKRLYSIAEKYHNKILNRYSKLPVLQKRQKITNLLKRIDTALKKLRAIEKRYANSNNEKLQKVRKVITILSVLKDMFEKDLKALPDPRVSKILDYFAHNNNYTDFDKTILSLQQKYLVPTLDKAVKVVAALNSYKNNKAYQFKGNVAASVPGMKIADISIKELLLNTYNENVQIKGDIAGTFNNEKVEAVFDLLNVNGKYFVKISKYLPLDKLSPRFKENLGKYVLIKEDRSSQEVKKKIKEFTEKLEKVKKIVAERPLIREIPSDIIGKKGIVAPSLAFNDIVGIIDENSNNRLNYEKELVDYLEKIDRGSEYMQYRKLGNDYIIENVGGKEKVKIIFNKDLIKTFSAYRDKNNYSRLYRKGDKVYLEVVENGKRTFFMEGTSDKKYKIYFTKLTKKYDWTISDYKTVEENYSIEIDLEKDIYVFDGSDGDTKVNIKLQNDDKIFDLKLVVTGKNNGVKVDLAINYNKKTSYSKVKFSVYAMMMQFADLEGQGVLEEEKSDFKLSGFIKDNYMKKYNINVTLKDTYRYTNNYDEDFVLSVSQENNEIFKLEYNLKITKLKPWIIREPKSYVK